MSPVHKRGLLLSLPLLGFAVLLWFLLRGLSNDPRLLPSVLIDQPLPAFNIATLHDPQKKVSNEDLKGSVSLLNVWATWCPTCIAEHGMLMQLAEQGIQIYGVNYKDDPPEARRLLEQLGNPYQFVIEDIDGQLGIDLGVYGAPETFLLDPHGVIRYRHVGDVNERVWNDIFLPKIHAIEEEST